MDLELSEGKCGCSTPSTGLGSMADLLTFRYSILSINNFIASYLFRLSDSSWYSPHAITLFQFVKLVISSTSKHTSEFLRIIFIFIPSQECAMIYLPSYT